MLEQTIKSRHKLVDISVVGSYEGGMQKVYNLTVEEAHLYYANGFLVTNTKSDDHCCDSIRYGLMSRRTAKDVQKVKKVKTVQEATLNELWEMHEEDLTKSGYSRV